MCEHAGRLGPDYVGLYCIYGCREKIAELGARDGQIFLKRDRHPRYLAVIQGNKQQEIKDLEEREDESQCTLNFKSGATFEVKTSKILLRFQDKHEYLNLDNPE